MKNIILIASVLFVFAACKKQDRQVDYTTKVIVLETEYINFAWGFQHSSSLIDTNGFIHRYDNTNSNNHAWKFSDSAGFISEADLQSNYDLTHVLSETINKDTITQSIALSKNISTNDLSDKTNAGADMGIIKYYAYVWDSTSNKYKKLFLGQCGDVQQFNNDPNAQAILNLIWKNHGYCF